MRLIKPRDGEEKNDSDKSKLPVISDIAVESDPYHDIPKSDITERPHLPMDQITPNIKESNFDGSMGESQDISTRNYYLEA